MATIDPERVLLALHHWGQCRAAAREAAERTARAQGFSEARIKASQAWINLGIEAGVIEAMKLAAILYGEGEDVV